MKTGRNPHQFSSFPRGILQFTGQCTVTTSQYPVFVSPSSSTLARCLFTSSPVVPLIRLPPAPRMSDSSDNAPTAESSPEQYALTEDGVLKVYSAGPVTVLGFGGHDVPSEFNVAHYRAAINEILLAHQSRIVAFDLTGVQLLPSGMLGLLVSISRMGPTPPRVQVCNAAPDIRDVLALTRINTLIEVCE